MTSFLGLGSNLGNRLELLKMAVRSLDDADGVTIQSVSPVYETEPVGGPPQGAYLNAVVMVETVLEVHDLYDECRRIETELGRVRRERWGPRTIDIDILLYGNAVIETDRLSIPHPHMAERAFVLKPLVDIAPEVVHPLLNKSVNDLLVRLDMSGMRLYGNIDFRHGI